MPPPPEPFQGQVCWDDTHGQLMIWSGTVWLPMAAEEIGLEQVVGVAPAQMEVSGLIGVADDPFPQYPLIVSGMAVGIEDGYPFGQMIPSGGYHANIPSMHYDENDEDNALVIHRDGKAVAIGYDGTLKLSNGQEANVFDMLDRLEKVEQQMVKVYKHLPWMSKRDPEM